MSREYPCSQQQCIGCVRVNLPAGSSLAGPKDVTLVPAKVKTQLQSTDGGCLFEAQTSQTDGILSLLHALARLVSRDGALVTGVTLQAAVTGLTVRLDVHLPLRLWEGTARWKRSAAAASVFAELGHTPTYPSQLATSATAEEFSLSSCFLELPSYVATPALLSPPPSPCQPADTKPSSSLEGLPDYIMAQVLSHLSHRHLAYASSVCTIFRDQAQHIVPGLDLHLYPHQVTTIRQTFAVHGHTREGAA